MENVHDRLEPFLGEWSMEVTAPWTGGEPSGDTGARVTFEWLAGEKFLVERWQVPIPEVPDGIAIIGHDEDRGTLLQHYFDSRGVARVYSMSVEDGVWELTRTEADFAPLDFSQRYRGTFTADEKAIEGRWEIDHGEGWEHDFDLSYRKVS